MNIDEVTLEWKTDCEINRNHLTEEALKTPNLHQKYLDILMSAKLKAMKYNSEYQQLRYMKFKYYRGELTRQELQERGWEQYQGVKPLKSDMDEFLNTDADLVKLKIRIDYCDALVYQLESIMKMISGRDWQIRNAIENNKFLAGN